MIMFQFRRFCRASLDVGLVTDQTRDAFIILYRVTVHGALFNRPLSRLIQTRVVMVVEFG